MEWLTIGAFSRASRLSPKALRLYDELGLLAPVRVDPDSGYRYYAPAQLERARLVAWLRRLGMPLVRIRDVCDAEAGAAAGEVRAYWAQVEAETAARRELAALLVDHLGREDTEMSTRTESPLEIRCAALSDIGLVRESNQDIAYAGPRLLAVADGFGGAGARAGAAAVDVFRTLEAEPVPVGALLNLLENAVERAGLAVHGVTAAEPSPEEVGTTLTAMLWDGSRLALVHIGDSRAYLLRDGELSRITHDHTMVQSLVDEGRLTPDEAAAHPQRALLTRALNGGGCRGGAPEMRLRDARAGDRYLLCSDGLSAVVPERELRRAVQGSDEPEAVARELVELARGHGAPDNVSCVVADVRESAR
ncbi:hypothetical protein N566_27230 [Streptomycetaceae bacterium MP113-05]|nr:hypothetical protein N566_27230 [Streptomycetaceae bacterium MP113-05]